MAEPEGVFDHRHYIPVLKGKAAEFAALRHAGEERGAFTPLIEIVPGDDDEDAREIERALRDGAKKLAQAWGVRDRVFVDPFLVSETTPLTGGRVAAQFLADELRGYGVQGIPVVRIGDDDRVIAAVVAVNASDHRGACLRVVPDDIADPDLRDAVTTLLTRLSMAPEIVDVIVDCREAPGGEFATLVAAGVVGAIGRLPDLGRWRSLTVVSGAFPADLSGRPIGRSEVTRSDVYFWREIRDAGPPRLPGYGDYTIAHPLLAIGVAFAPAPQLRYVTEEEWLVWRGSKRDPRGAQQFYDHCAHLVASGRYSGPDLSWGDRYIGQAAASSPPTAPPQVGPGNPTTWRSVGTSHHIAFVVNRLTTVGEP